VFLICGTLIFFGTGFRIGTGVQWNPYDRAMLSKAMQQEKPVILDFYADWCAPCRAMDEEVFRDPEVTELSKEFVMLRIDITRKHPHQEELQKRYQIRGVPTIVFINSKGREVNALRLELYVDRDEMIKRMKSLIKR